MTADTEATATWTAYADFMKRVDHTAPPSISLLQGDTGKYIKVMLLAPLLMADLLSSPWITNDDYVAAFDSKDGVIISVGKKIRKQYLCPKRDFYP